MMSLKYLKPEMTMEERSSRRETLGLSFTIDYLLFNKGVKGSTEEATGSGMAEQTASSMLNHHNLTTTEEGIRSSTQETLQPRSEVEPEERNVKEEEGDEAKPEEGEEDVTTTISTATLTSNSKDKSVDKPSQSYIALISKAILASEQKKLLLCDIYQWIMDHYPYFKSKDKNWRNSVRHNLSLNDCFIKAGRSDNGKGHFWAIHPSNYQDFSKGDYHCRRARRRLRRGTPPVSISSQSSPYNPSMVRPHRVPCWCCPQVQTLSYSALSYMQPRLYWPWSSVQPQVGLHPGLH